MRITGEERNNPLRQLAELKNPVQRPTDGPWSPSPGAAG